MTKYFNNQITHIATAFVVLTLIVLGSFFTTAKAEAATSATVVTETFPLLVSGAKLALSAVLERSKSGALASATVASDQKIAELMTRLNELMTLYKSLASQTGSDSSEDSLDASDDTDVPIRPSHYIQVLTPNGGETYINGGYGNATNLSPEIDIKYKASGIVGEKLVVYLYSPEDGNVRTFSRIAADFDSIKINIAKGDTLVIPGDYKIILCVPERQMPDSDKTLCDASDNYFKVVGDPGATSPVPAIKVLHPNGGEVLTHGKTYDFKWSSTGVSPRESVALYLMETNGSLHPKHFAVRQNNGIYRVTLNNSANNFPVGKYKLYIATPPDDVGIDPKIISDTSDNYFIIESSNSGNPVIDPPIEIPLPPPVEIKSVESSKTESR